MVSMPSASASASEEFTIPLDKDELARTHFGSYGHQDVVPLQLIAKEISAINVQQLSDSKPVDIALDKLNVFLSVVIHGNKVELTVLLKTFSRILKIVQGLISYLEKNAEQSHDFDFEPNDKSKLLTANKILAYIMSSILCIIEDLMADHTNNMGHVGKRKKNVQKSDFEEEWEACREKAMETIYRWLQLPLKNLWIPPIVEDTFVGTVSQMCYKILEKTKDARSKVVRNLVFQILGTLVKRYNHGIACVVRIIQLAKFHETLAAPIGNGVVLMVTEHGCSGLIKEIAREIGESEPGEADARNFSTFLETIATAQPEIVVPILENITDYLGNDCYVMRNCAITIIGVIVAKTLTGEDLPAEKRITRDECLDDLEKHILDCNAYVRSKVIQTWQNLCCEAAVPLSRQNSLLKASVSRLTDKSANVRKQALQLLRTLLQSNPFASKMNQESFVNKLKQVKAELKELQTDVYHTVGAEEAKEELWKTQVPLIEEAIDKIFMEEIENTEADENIEAQEKEDIDFKEIFDKIQNYILKDKCLKAVKNLHKLFVQRGLAKDMKNISKETKKEVLLLFMYKIFMNSSAEQDANAKEKSKEALSADPEELKQLDEIKKKKILVDYLENCCKFSTELEKTIPTVENLLYSVHPGDAIEACSFLGAAYQFQIAGALEGVRKALFQIFYNDQSVKDNLTTVYKEIYLNPSVPQMTSRAKAVLSVRSLIKLLDGMEDGQSIALGKLIVQWREKGDLDAEALKVMWEMFSLKLPNTTPLESRSAIMLLTMVAQMEPDIITDNLDVLIKVGLSSRAQTDLLLARDTCRAFLTIKQDNSKDKDNMDAVLKPPIRYRNDHEIFQLISSLLKETFAEDKENGYLSFATDAVNVIYHLADQPDQLMKDILAHTAKVANLIRTSNEENLVEAPSQMISRFLYLVGHTAIRQMVHLDQSIYKELKRRNAVREKKKEMKARMSNVGRRKSMNVSTVSVASNASVQVPGSAQRSIRRNMTEDDQEHGMEGATADDADAEHINICLEEELLAEGSYLRKFVPFILDICQHPEKYTDEVIQAQAVLALSKFMTISSTFCEGQLQLLVTILERSPYPEIRSNILIGLADLMTRFPNQIEPWTSHIYGRLKDDNIKVRSTCVQMLSNLILGEMIRVKGQVAQLTLCLVDENETIRSDTQQLFKDLSQKGNALYNVMPDILSCLSDSDLNLSEKNFQEIIKYILGLLQKDRQVDSIIEKLSSRFKLATTERQWRDLSFCLSMLKFSAKGIRILIKDLPFLKEKIHNDDVQRALNGIIDQAKRRPEAKVASLELEEKIKELLDNTENLEEPRPVSDSEAMPPPSRPIPKSAKAKKKTRLVRREESDEEEEEMDAENCENRPLSRNSSSIIRPRRGRSESRSDTTNGDSGEEDSNRTPRKPAKKNLRTENSRTPVSTRRTPRSRR